MMTDEQLIADINSIINLEGNFKTPLHARDSYNKVRFARRSFEQLMGRYTIFWVNEKQLMKAIKSIGLIARYCPDARNIVFFKDYSGYKNSIKFWWNKTLRNSAFNKILDLKRTTRREGHTAPKFKKYTPMYLEELYDNV